MAETLVWDLCEHRPPLRFGGLFIGTRLEPLISDCFRLFCELFFPLLAIVLAPAAFLKLAQSLAL